jgi:hypothetical protein
LAMSDGTALPSIRCNRFYHNLSLSPLGMSGCGTTLQKLVAGYSNETGR